MTDKTNGVPEFNWEDIINKSVDAWPEPPIAPIGFWHFRAKGGKLDKGRGTFTIPLALVAPVANVDEDEVTKLGDLAAVTPVFASFRLSRQDDVTRLKALIRAVGLGQYDLENVGKAMKNVDFMGEIVHQPRQDGSDVPYVNVRRLGPLTAN